MTWIQKYWQQTFILTALAVCALGGYYLLPQAISDREALWEASNEAIREKGAEAYRAGIPSNANPCIRSQSDAQLWLDGYIREKQKGE